MLLKYATASSRMKLKSPLYSYQFCLPLLQFALLLSATCDADFSFVFLCCCVVVDLECDGAISSGINCCHQEHYVFLIDELSMSEFICTLSHGHWISIMFWNVTPAGVLQNSWRFSLLLNDFSKQLFQSEWWSNLDEQRNASTQHEWHPVALT